MPTRCIHITPELPPSVGGVADYTVILSRRLVEASGGTVQPVLVRAGWKHGEPRIEVPFASEDIAGSCSATTLARVVERLAAQGPAFVLLEYSGYGYAKRGAPWWLVRGLRRVCGPGRLPLITMFHEVRATDWRPWTSAFWLSPVQAHVARSLASLSDALVTNRADIVSWLRRRGRCSAEVRMQPVFSNVGEPNDLQTKCLPNEGVPDEAYAVVFGGGGKKVLYERHGNRFGQLLERLNVRHVLDIGPAPPAGARLGAARVEVLGLLPSVRISALLHGASLGLVCRNPAAMTKSGALAALLAHAVPAVVAVRHAAPASGTLRPGVHFLTLEHALATTAEATRTDLARVGGEALRWYRTHAHSSRAARTFLDLLPQAVQDLDL